MQYPNALNTIAQTFKWPVVAELSTMAPGLRTILPLDPVTITHDLNGEALTLHGPLPVASEGFVTLSTVSVDGQEIEIWAETDLLGVALGRAGYNEDTARYPADALALTLEHLTRPVLELLGQSAAARQVIVTGHEAAGHRKPDGDTIRFTVSGDELSPLTLTVSGAVPILETIARMLNPAARQTERPRLDAAEVTFDCTLLAPEFEISAEELSGLKEDDVMLLDARWLEAEGYRICIADTLVATVTRDGDTASVQSDFERLKRNEPMTRSNDALSDLPVTIGVELARKPLTLAEVEAISTGDVLTFEDVSLNVVSLTANGRVMGQGVLVRSGDQVGIRLTTVA